MRKLLSSIGLAGLCFGLMAAHAGEFVLRPGKTEVVIAADAPKTVRFAATELTNFLSRAFGAPVPMREGKEEGREEVKKVGEERREEKVGEESRWTKDGFISIVLGDNEWARAAGIDVTKLPRDGFVIRALQTPKPPNLHPSGRIFIAGRDDAKDDLAGIIADGHLHRLRGGERATLFGVYEFLERFAGCRFFFPGELGEVVPRTDAIAVPATDLALAPSFAARDVYMGGDGRWFADEKPANRGYSSGKCLNWLRLRLETEHIPCCHGQNGFMIPERFHESHPEYFQLRKDGTRCPWKPRPGGRHWEQRQLCQSSAVWDVFYGDAKAYLTGRDAGTRGIPSRWNPKTCGWNANCGGGRYVDVMPQDAYARCECPSCRAAYRKDGTHYATDLVWGQTAKLARRLKAEGVPGYVVQMSYTPYGEVPPFDLPDNILVMVAQGGPWCVRNAKTFDSQIALFRAWRGKTHRRVLTWTYPHKYGATAIPALPCVAPRAHGAYWKRAAPFVCGGFLETESDSSAYQLFNYYVYSKVAWDPSVDVDALIADHHEKMFGKGAAAMAEFYDTLEDAWLSVVGAVRDTPLGPVASVPGEYEIKTRIYSPEKLARLGACCDEALRAAAGDAMAERRIDFVRAQYLAPLAAESARYRDLVSVDRELARRRQAGSEPNLVPEADFTGEANPKGWFPGWSGLRRDTATYVTAPAAARITHTNRLYGIRYFRKGELKPSTRYRCSYFLKMKDVRKLGKSDSGVHFAFFDGTTETRFPAKGALDGTTDWIHQSFEVKTGSDAERLRNGLVCLRLMNACGTVWIDDVRVTELPAAAIALKPPPPLRDP